MTATGSGSALQRKMAAGRESAPAGARTALRALRLALARSASEVFELSLVVIGATQTRCAHADLAGYLQDDALLVLLDGPDGLIGAASLDKDCLAVLIQQQTMGQVTGIAPADRTFTSTDAALAAPLIDATLTQAAELADLPADQRCLTGYQFGARAEDTRSLFLALEADKYRIFALTLDFAAGKQQGNLCIALPEIPEITTKDGDDHPTGPRLEQAIATARADLTAVICRINIPLSEMADMVPGDVFPLVRDHLNQTDLVSINGTSVAAGRLGQIGGLRAIRLNETQPDSRHMGQDDNGFAARIEVPRVVSEDAMTIEETALPVPQATDQGAGLPAIVEDDTPISDLTPEQAAAEISELAGLRASDMEGTEPEITP